MPSLRKLIAARVIVDDELDGLQWASLAKLFVPVLMTKAQSARVSYGRDGNPLRPLIWSEKHGEFRRAKSYQVTRLYADPDLFSVFDFVELCYWLDGKRSAGAEQREGRDLLQRCIEYVDVPFRRRLAAAAPPIGSIARDQLVSLVAASLRSGADRLDEYWSDSSTKSEAPPSLEATETAVEEAMRHVLTARLGDRFSWIARSDPRMTPKPGELVFIVEPLSGRRNLRSGVPVYCLALAAARCVSASPVQLAPICAGVHVPNARHLYIGVAPSGGAALIDERLGHVHALPYRLPRGRDVTVAIHHSRRLPQVSRAFVDRLSAVLPKTVDKELALGSGALHLALTAAGGLAAFFDPAIRGCSAYPGAILLCAATGQSDAATDLAGTSWLEGDPLAKEGILAWSNRRLRKQLEGELVP